MVKYCLDPQVLPYSLEAHKTMVLHVESEVLKKNPLGDSFHRQNYALVPLGKKKAWPVIFHLSGYFSTGFQSFHKKTLASNIVQQIDQGVKKGHMPKAVHIFVEADTYWGGSQFINSPGCGRYSDYILRELIPGVTKKFPVLETSKHWCVMGASSGGYGALHLVSERKSPFGLGVAIAPDSFFEASLLPELFHAAPELAKYKNFSQIKKLIEEGEIQNKKSFFNLMNVIAMSLCYSPKAQLKKDFLNFPIDLYSGEVNSSVWKSWLKHDPIVFLKKRKEHLKGKEILLDVGKYDNFSLQFGTRQIAGALKSMRVKHSYQEFPGTHFGLTARRVEALKSLKKRWNF